MHAQKKKVKQITAVPARAGGEVIPRYYEVGGPEYSSTPQLLYDEPYYSGKRSEDLSEIEDSSNQGSGMIPIHDHAHHRQPLPIPTDTQPPLIPIDIQPPPIFTIEEPLPTSTDEQSLPSQEAEKITKKKKKKHGGSHHHHKHHHSPPT